MTQTIVSTVGLNSANRSSDVLVIQALLNGVPTSFGGPTTVLELDGLFGDNTAQAISTFQMRQFGWADCVVAPGQVTLQRLNALSRQTDANVAAVVKTVVALIGNIGRIPGVYASFGAPYVLLKSLSARLEPAILVVTEPATDTRTTGVRGAFPIFGDVIPFPEIPGGGAGAGVGPQAILLFLLLMAYIIGHRPVAIPQTDADKVLQRDLSELEKLTNFLSVEKAKEVQKQIKADVKSIEDCSNQRLERVVVGGRCNTLFELYKKVSADVLRKLNRYITGPLTFPGLLKALNDSFANYDALLKALRECLECDKLDKQRTFLPRTRSRAGLPGWAATARPSVTAGRSSCRRLPDCSSCPKEYVASEHTGRPFRAPRRTRPNETTNRGSRGQPVAPRDS